MGEWERMNETHKRREPASQRHSPEKGCGMLGCACGKHHSWSGQEMCPAEDEILYRDVREHRDCRGKKRKPKSKIKKANNIQLREMNTNISGENNLKTLLFPSWRKKTTCKAWNWSKSRRQIQWELQGIATALPRENSLLGFSMQRCLITKHWRTLVGLH